MKRPLSWLLASLLVTSPVLAQSGFVLFGAKDQDYILNYHLSKDRVGSQSTTYELQLKPQKVAVRQVQVILPDRYLHSFDTNLVELYSPDGNTPFPVAYTQLDPDNSTLTVAAKDPIPSGIPITVRFKNVTNPRSPGIFKLRARLLGTEPNPLYRYVGDWYISIN
jgi:hypothetical protein